MAFEPRIVDSDSIQLDAVWGFFTEFWPTKNVRLILHCPVYFGLDFSLLELHHEKNVFMFLFLSPFQNFSGISGTSL